MNAISGITAQFDVSLDKGVDDFSSVTPQWANRPDDQRYLSVDDMVTELENRTVNTVEHTVPLADVRPVIHEGGLAFDMGGRMVTPTHHSFSRLCQEAEGVPTAFIRQLYDDPDLAVRCLDRGLRASLSETPDKQLMTMETKGLLRSVTSTQFGRVWDLDAVRSIKRMIGDGDTWRVPTAFARPGFKERAPEVTKQATTLYMSDRDIFMFLVDETRPIQGGFLSNGEPDMYSRGFIFSNTEVGGTCCYSATFLYKWICENRSIREQKGFGKMSTRHTKNAPTLVMNQMLPALEMFISGKATGVVDGFEMKLESEKQIQARLVAAKAAKLNRISSDAPSFLHNIGLGPKMAQDLLGVVIDEEGHPVESIFDVWNGLTALAKRIPHQDARVELETKAGLLLDEVTV
jgi:hypothetical protein